MGEGQLLVLFLPKCGFHTVKGNVILCLTLLEPHACAFVLQLSGAGLAPLIRPRADFGFVPQSGVAAVFGRTFMVACSAS